MVTIIILALVVSLLSVGVAVWSMRQTSRLNHELDAMEAAAAKMLHDMTQRELEEVGQ
jgi:hypothetical protein